MSRERLIRAEQIKASLANIKNEISTIQNYIRDLHWSNLPLVKVHHNSETKYTFNFPEEIKTTYAALEEMVAVYDNDRQRDFHSLFHYVLYGETTDRFNSLDICAIVYESNNRIHIPDVGMGNESSKFRTRN